MERRSSLRASRSTAGSSSRAGPSTDRISRSSRPSSGGQPLRTDLRGASRSDGPEVITIEDSDNPDEASDSLSELSSPAKTLGAYRKMSTDYKGKGKARDVAPAVFEPGHLSSIAMDDIEAGGASPLTSGLSSAAAGSPAAPSPLDRSTGRGGGIAGRGRRGRGGPVSTLGQTRPRKEPERRVLPARIRRAAGGGAEGIRELEEMIVDWLERYGEPRSSPPPSLPIYITSLPMALVDPPVLDPPPDASTSRPPDPPGTPTRSAGQAPETSTSIADAGTSGHKIRVPAWRMVRAGEDDAEEAREEMSSRKAMSPVKRLRGLAGDQALEDVSDAYYMALHKKYEVFERRQRIREKEKLQFERYKMRSRVDLLRNMADIPWITVVNTVLARYAPDKQAGGGIEAVDDAYRRGREKVLSAGPGWLRARLVQEGKEVLKRFDQLLPPEHRKNKMAESRLSTPAPSVSVPSPSVSPPPPAAAVPARVSALRDNAPASAGSGRKRGSGLKLAKHTPGRAPPGRKRVRNEEDGSAPAGDSPLSEEEEVDMVDAPTPSKPPKAARTYKRKSVLMPSTAPDLKTDTTPAEADRAQAPPSPSLSPSTSRPRSPPLRPARPAFVPPQNASGLPYLVEAASRRETSIEETLTSQARVAQGRTNRFIAREKTRASSRLGLVHPFGMPFPANVEWKSEFAITDIEDFWSIIAAREAGRDRARRESLGIPIGSTGPSDLPALTAATSDRSGSGASAEAGVDVSVSVVSGSVPLSADEVREMREVEAAVVI